MIKRSEKLAFMEVTENSETVLRRMTGFTELSVSKNPKEYSRKYIDEIVERTSVVGYSPSISYKFDYEPDNSVHKEFAEIADMELTGDAAIKSIIIVDLTATDGLNGCKAIKRDFSIIPSNEGDDTDTYTCSGSMKAIGEIQTGTAISEDDWQTIEFVAD